MTGNYDPLLNSFQKFIKSWSAY